MKLIIITVNGRVLEDWDQEIRMFSSLRFPRGLRSNSFFSPPILPPDMKFILPSLFSPKSSTLANLSHPSSSWNRLLIWHYYLARASYQFFPLHLFSCFLMSLWMLSFIDFTPITVNEGCEALHWWFNPLTRKWFWPSSHFVLFFISVPLVVKHATAFSQIDITMESRASSPLKPA